MIIDRVDDIIAFIENNERHESTNGGGFTIDFVAWDNRYNRVVVAMWSRHPSTALDFTDMNDAVNRFNIVWGVRAYEMQNDGIVIIENLRMIDDPMTSYHGVDGDGDEVLR